MRKPRWHSVDWVELGCRGWDIELTGAVLGPQVESPWEYDYVSLDRQTLHVVMSGRATFIARVFSDLRAAGLVADFYEWVMDSGTSHTTTDNTFGVTLNLVA